MENTKKTGDIKELLSWDSTTLLRACLVKEIMEEITPSIKVAEAEALVNRIFDLTSTCDVASFSTYDYVDAFIYWPPAMQTIPLDALMALPDDDFRLVMLAIAEQKRATYSDDVMPLSSLATKRLQAIAAQTKQS